MKRETPKPSAEWDRHSIKTEVHRRGMSLRQIGLERGLSQDACKLGLRGLSRKGADAIADALGIPFDTLFPMGMYSRSRSSHAKPTAKGLPESRQKRTGATTEARARA